MLGGLVKGVAGAASTGLRALGDAAEATGDIVGNLVDGEKPNTADIVKLGSAGWTVAEIASFYGVAQHVIEEMQNDG